MANNYQINQKRDFNPFNRVEVNVPQRNTFDLSHDNKLTLDMGKLVPVLVQDTLPGDKFTITPEMLIRFAPMTFPIMQKIDATIHFFYVPNRISWNNWKKFLANEKVEGSEYVPPYILGDGETSFLNVTASSLHDYIGLPNGTIHHERIDAFPYLAYLRIYNEYYQDQNNDASYLTIRNQLESMSEIQGGKVPPDQLFNNSSDNYADWQLQKRAWEHDYFTSALPWAQKGDAVNIPLELISLTGTATGNDLVHFDNTPATDGTLSSSSGHLWDTTPTAVWLKSNLDIDTQNAELSGTINQLRTAMALQKFLEKNARSGTRYNELILAHFGEHIGDARINRPEYLGGIQNNVVISEVLQTSQTDDSSALGDYAGHATAVVNGNTIQFECPEHGYIIGILSVKPTTSYFQGIPRKFSRMTFLDYYWQEFANIGEQAILNKELYYDNALSDNNDTFGYIPRYSEYKYNPSAIHGNFRTDMKDFHLARYFGSRPALNKSFIEVNDDKRIFAVTEEGVNSLYAHIFFNIKADRKIPFFTSPQGL